MRRYDNISPIKQVLYFIYFINVRNDILAARYDRAMFFVNRMYSLFDARKPSNRVKVHLNLIYGMVAWNLGNFDDVYSACRVAIDQIQENLLGEKDQIKITRLKYLRAYSKTLVGFADLEGGIRTEFDFSDIDSIRQPDYDLKYIDAFLQKIFPVGDTGWW